MVTGGSSWLVCPEKNLKCLREFHRRMDIHSVGLLVSICSWLCVFPRAMRSLPFQAALVCGTEASTCLRQILTKEERLTVTTCLRYEAVIVNLSLSTVLLQKEAGGHNYCGVLTKASVCPGWISAIISTKSIHIWHTFLHPFCSLIGDFDICLVEVRSAADNLCHY